MLPLEFKKMRKKEAARQAQQLLQRVGLESRIYKQFPKMMSGGEQQRVAIARAVAAGGEIILADEPTGNLDSKNSRDVMDMLLSASRKYRQTVLMITHNANLTTVADRVFRVSDGMLEELGREG